VFYYERLLDRALSGIDGTAIISTIVNISYSILLLALLFAVYQAFTRGGDIRELGISSIKYLTVGLALATYAGAFRQVNGMFNSLAGFIDTSSAARDGFLNWQNELRAYWTASGNVITWNLLTASLAALINAALVVLGYIIYPITYTIFSIFYTFYGSVLYVLGPLVLALLPIAGIGQLARTYLINLMIFNAWGLIYVIFGSMITALNVNHISFLTSDSSFLGSFEGLSLNTLIGIVSVIYALAIALIPYIASRIVRGEVGSTLFAVAGTAALGFSTVAAALGGAVAGSSAVSRAIESGGSASSGGTPLAVTAPPLPPPPPPPGRWHNFNFAHAAGYGAGYTMAKAGQTVQSLFP
jgi:hypothetical protein